MLIFDTVIFALTLLKAWQVRQAAGQASSLMQVMLRDGAYSTPSRVGGFLTHAFVAGTFYFSCVRALKGAVHHANFGFKHTFPGQPRQYCDASRASLCSFFAHETDAN